MNFGWEYLHMELIYVESFNKNCQRVYQSGFRVCTHRSSSQEVILIPFVNTNGHFFCVLCLVFSFYPFQWESSCMT